MQFHLFVSSLALTLSFWDFAHANPSVELTTLLPINLRDFESKIHGIQRRDSAKFSDLDPATQAQLVYGNKGENGQFILANMTLEAPNGLEIVLMEKFEGLTKEVDCKGDDGSMSLTFKSKDAFEQALKKWDFINKGEDKNFLLIANHDGCGPDDERQPYKISAIREDPKALTTFLTAKPAPWSEVAGTYTLDFGKILSPSNARRNVHQRDLIGDVVKTGEGVVKDVGKSVDNAAQSAGDVFKNLGNVDISKNVVFGIGIGTPGLRTNIYSSPDKKIKLDCIDCYISGKFTVTGRIVVKKFELQDFTINASPVTVTAKAVLEATITSDKKLLTVNQVKELFAIGVPGAGIAVTGIFKIGATLAYQVGATSNFAGQGIVDFGIQAGIPDTAKVVAAVKTPASNSAINFLGPITPVFNVKSLTASVNLVAFTQAKLAFGAEITNVGKADIAITLLIPKVSAQLTAVYAPNGFCTTTPGSSKTGVKLASQVDIEVDLDYDANFGTSPVPAKRQTLFATSAPLLNTCFPLAIPGLGR